MGPITRIAGAYRQEKNAESDGTLRSGVPAVGLLAPTGAHSSSFRATSPTPVLCSGRILHRACRPSIHSTHLASRPVSDNGCANNNDRHMLRNHQPQMVCNANELQVVIGKDMLWSLCCRDVIDGVHHEACESDETSFLHLNSECAECSVPLETPLSDCVSIHRVHNDAHLAVVIGTEIVADVRVRARCPRCTIRGQALLDAARALAA